MTAAAPPVMSDEVRGALADLFAWRRDVRRFRTDPVDEALVERLLDLAQLAPSVGNSQPWRWVRVETPAAREAIRRSFEQCNSQALAGYEGERAQQYSRLKLSGLEAAPVQFGVFADRATLQGHGLGRASMPEVVDYSVVCAICHLWLAARAEGLGLGWVSILEPAEVTRVLDVPAAWRFIAYLCLGWPSEEHVDPELVRAGWQERTAAGRTVLRR